VRAASLGVWETELPSGRISSSDTFIDMIGLPPGSASPTCDEFLQMVHPEDRPAFAAAQRRILTVNGEALEFRIVRPDGAVRWLYMRAQASRGTDGRPERVFGATIDVTDRKELESSLRQAQTLEAVGQLAGGVAHDFNNVLTAVIGYSDLLQAEAAPGTQILQPRVLDVNGLIVELERMLRRVVYEHVQIVTRLAPDVGRIRADPTQYSEPDRGSTFKIYLPRVFEDAGRGGTRDARADSSAVERRRDARGRRRGAVRHAAGRSAVVACALHVRLRQRDDGGARLDVERHAASPEAVHRERARPEGARRAGSTGRVRRVGG